MILTALALVNARIRLLTNHTMHILNRVLNVLLFKHDLRVLKPPKPIYQHTKNMGVVGLIHWQVEEASRAAELAFTDTGTFALVVFGEETGFADALSFGDVTVFVVADVALCAEGEGVVQFMEVAETATAGCFEHRSGFFAAFLQLSFPYVLVEVPFLSYLFQVWSSLGIFIVFQFLKMVEKVDFFLF